MTTPTQPYTPHSPVADPGRNPAGATAVTGSNLQSTTPLAAAKTPVGPGVITAVGLTLAVLVIALGVVGVHDALVAAGALNGTGWIDAVAESLNEITPAVWLVPLGIALVLLGLLLVLAALRPRPRTAIALQARTGVFLGNRDVATLARNAVQEVDGVTSAKVTANRRKVAVAARTTTTDGVEQSITEAVAARLQSLSKVPAVRVKLKMEGGS